MIKASSLSDLYLLRKSLEGDRERRQGMGGEGEKAQC